MPHRTPCIDSADDRAGRFENRRTPCIDSADDRARRWIHHRTPCTQRAGDRADKRCTPCISTDTSPRTRMAPSCEGLSSASSPSSSPPLRHPPCPRLHHSRRGTLSRPAARSSSSSSSLPRLVSSPPSPSASCATPSCTPSFVELWTASGPTLEPTAGRGWAGRNDELPHQRV
jgi:hypothetical protein